MSGGHTEKFSWFVKLGFGSERVKREIEFHWNDLRNKNSEQDESHRRKQGNVLIGCGNGMHDRAQSDWFVRTKHINNVAAS